LSGTDVIGISFLIGVLVGFFGRAPAQILLSAGGKGYCLGRAFGSRSVLLQSKTTSSSNELSAFLDFSNRSFDKTSRGV